MSRTLWQFLGVLLAASIAGIALGEVGKRQQEERRARATAFYHKHHCRPAGYVTGEYGPVRTYQCDNGVHIWDHMQ